MTIFLRKSKKIGQQRPGKRDQLLPLKIVNNCEKSLMLTQKSLTMAFLMK